MQLDPPTSQQLVLAAVHMVCHGPYASAHQRARLLHPCAEPLGHNGAMLQAELVLKTVVDAVFAVLRPEDLDRISQALEQAREKWPPRFEAQGDGSHWRLV